MAVKTSVAEDKNKKLYKVFFLYLSVQLSDIHQVAVAVI